MKVSASSKLAYVVLATSYFVMLARMPVLNGLMAENSVSHRKAITKSVTATTEKTYRTRLGNCGFSVCVSFSSFLILALRTRMLLLLVLAWQFYAHARTTRQTILYAFETWES